MREIAGHKNLTSREAARLLGVSEASVKRWADAGLLPVLKTVGGHRRFRPADVAAFRRTGLTRARTTANGDDASHARRHKPHAHGRAKIDDNVRATLFDALVAGQDEAAAALIVNLYLHGHTVAGVADKALCPALRQLGDRWHAGLLTVAQEHVATGTALAALAALRVSLAAVEPRRLVALCCSVEEDFHEVPIHLAALVVEAEGWEAITLGASTPFYALAEAVLRFTPRVVCVAATMLTRLDRAAREYGEFRAAADEIGAAVVLGGAGFAGAGWRARCPAELYADNFKQLESFVAMLGADEATA